MNEYKLAWMQESNADFDYATKRAKPNDSPSFAKSVFNHVVEDVADDLAVYGLISIAAYMATNQFSNPYLRFPIGVIGKIGVRALPVIGVAYAAYSVYNEVHDWLD